MHNSVNEIVKGKNITASGWKGPNFGTIICLQSSKKIGKSKKKSNLNAQKSQKN